MQVPLSFFQKTFIIDIFLQRKFRIVLINSVELFLLH